MHNLYFRISYRDPVEIGGGMFGISPSLDRALEVKLLNNLKVYLNVISTNIMNTCAHT